MRILFLTHYYPPEVNAPANRTHEHCREWVRSGHEVHLITGIPSHPRGEPFAGYHRAWYQHETTDGVHVHRVWTYLAPNTGVARRLANYLSFVPSATWRSLRLGTFDVVIATSPQFFCAVAGRIVGALKRTLRKSPTCPTRSHPLDTAGRLQEAGGPMVGRGCLRLSPAATCYVATR